jgi:hypothetical protein
MATNRFLDNIFETGRGSVSAEEAMVRHAWVEGLEQDDAEARLYAQKLIDWYNRDTAAIREYIKETAKPLFTKSADRWLIPVLNIVPRVVKRISLAYVQAPTRRLKQGDKEVPVGSDLWDRVYGPAGMFRLIDIDNKYKQMDRLSTLLNTLHVEVVPRAGAIDWDLHLRSGTTVVPDPADYLSLVKLAYRYCPMDPETLKLREGWVYWSEDIHAYRLDNGEWHGISLTDEAGDREGDNPYEGEIPIVAIRKVEQDDYWGAYGADLIEGVEHTHVQLCNMWFNAFMQSHGQPVGTNLKLPTGQKLVVGPDSPILVDGVTKDDVPPSLVFAKPDSETGAVQELLEWFIGKTGQAYGLPASAWSLDETPESGFAKFMNNIELLEDRDDSRTMWRKAEQELFAKSLMVWNRWAQEQGEKPLPDDLTLEIEFPPVKFPESPTEKTSRYLVAIKAGITSPVRYFMEEEGLPEDEAKKKAIAIATENEEIAGATVDMEAARMKKLDFGQNGPAAAGPKKPEPEKE